jgi:ATP-dependent Clp protease ATP-binding subunit ClpA
MNDIEQALLSLKISCKNITQLFLTGDYEKVIFRDKEKNKAVVSLLCQRKNSLIVVGESGVGKSVFVHSLAELLYYAFPERLLIEVSSHDILAGCRYRGDFEERMSKILNLSEENSVILYLDEAHTLSMTGGADVGGIDALNILKPYLSRGLQCILSTTIEESEKLLVDKAFARRFRKLLLKEIDKERYYEVIISKFDTNTLDVIGGQKGVKSVVINNPDIKLHELIDEIDFKISEHKVKNTLHP